jgi:hypothetical protein
MRKVIDATSQPRASTQKSSLQHRKTTAALSASTANLAQNKHQVNTVRHRIQTRPVLHRHPTAGHADVAIRPPWWGASR